MKRVTLRAPKQKRVPKPRHTLKRPTTKRIGSLDTVSLLAQHFLLHRQGGGVYDHVPGETCPGGEL